MRDMNSGEPLQNPINSTSLEEILENFIFNLQVEGKRPKTISWYKEMLTPFAKYINSLSNFNILTVRRYIVSLQERGLKTASIQTHTRAIKSFLNFLFREGIISQDTGLKIKRQPLPKQDPYVLNDEQIFFSVKSM